MNKSDITEPKGWWLVALLMQNINSDCPKYWNNYRLIKADAWEEAYKKAIAIGEDEERNDAVMKQKFIGITDFVAIYEPFEDGAELFFAEYEDGEEIPSTVSRDEIKKLMEEKINV